MSQVPENPSYVPEDKRELLSPSPIEGQKNSKKFHDPNDMIMVNQSTYYPLAQFEHEADKHVLPLQSAGLLGKGYVDLSSYKAEKLKIKMESIPTDIVEKMVFFLPLLKRYYLL